MKPQSIEAYHLLKASGRKTTLKLLTLAFIRDNRGANQDIISRELGESARKRVAELLDDCLIVEMGLKKTRGEGYRMTYEAVENPQLNMSIRAAGMSMATRLRICRETLEKIRDELYFEKRDCVSLAAEALQRISK